MGRILALRGILVAGIIAHVLTGRRVLDDNRLEDVKVSTCDHCGARVEPGFRFCPWCAAPQRLKIVEFFPADPTIDTTSEGLRVSRYFGDHTHSRFSVWSAGRTEAVVSLDSDESDRLGRFLSPPAADRANVWTSALHRNVRALRNAISR